MDLRYACCDFIQCCVILLKLPQRAAGTAQILFHRYFTLKSFVKAGSRFSYEHILMACLLLASKLEDAPRKCRDVINLKQLKDCEGPSSRNSHNFKRVQLDDQYVVLKHVLQKVERKLLNVLGFVVNIDHHIVAFLQKSWNYANDSFRSTVYLRYRFEAVACACVHLASTAIDYPVILPQDPAWFELFDVSLEEILAISDILRKIYEKAEVKISFVDCLSCQCRCYAV
uniref:Cyclin-like domain-containing protein n=1 Tax=Ditylenchus dipsaci TaxID=166011 RepID=A0A915DBW5_9BILA